MSSPQFDSILEIVDGHQHTFCLRSSVSPPVGDLEQPLLRQSEPIPEDATCRICCEHNDKLLKPCWCLGSVQYVCRTCLRGYRSYQGKGIRCELCGFAFLYEAENMNLWDRVKLAWFRSARPLLLFIGCVGYTAIRTPEMPEQEALKVIGLLGVMIFLEGLRFQMSIWRSILIWFSGALLCLYLSHQTESPRLIEKAFPVLLFVIILQDGLFDLHESLVEPALGSLGYAIKRVRGGFDANALEIWELHKKEWAKGGIFPKEEEDADRPDTCEDRCKWGLQGLAIIIGFYFSSCMMLWVSLAPEAEKVLEQDTSQMIACSLLVVSAGYLFVAVAMHWLSVFRVPTIKLKTDLDGRPLVRSLKEHEMYLRPMSRQSSPVLGPAPPPGVCPNESRGPHLPL